MAARARFLSPAAFSKRVQQVEEHVGAPLFARTTRTVELTHAGEALLPQDAGQQPDEARVLAGGATHAGPTPAELTLGTRHELGMSWLMPRGARFREDLPHLTVRLRFGGAKELGTAVLSLRADAVVTSHAPSTKRLDSHSPAPRGLRVRGRAALLRKTPLAHADDAGAHALVDAHDDLPLFAYLRATGLPLRFAHVLVLGTIAAIREAVLDGEGVAVLPRYFVAPDLERGGSSPCCLGAARSRLLSAGVPRRRHPAPTPRSGRARVEGAAARVSVSGSTPFERAARRIDEVVRRGVRTRCSARCADARSRGRRARRPASFFATASRSG